MGPSSLEDRGKQGRLATRVSHNYLGEGRFLGRSLRPSVETNPDPKSSEKVLCMRARSSRILATLLTLSLVGAGFCTAQAAEEPNLEGKWKLLLISPLRESELLLLDIKPHDSKWEASIMASGLPPQVPRKVKSLERKGENLVLELGLGAVDLILKGTMAKDGNVYGTIMFNGQLTPARMVKTEAKTVTQDPNEGTVLIQEYLAARRVVDPKVKAKKLAEILEKEAASPKLAMIHADLLQIAESAGLSDKTVKGFVESLVDNARPYGTLYTAEAQAIAMKALAGQKSHAELALELGLQAEKGFGADAPTQAKSEISRGIADAAKLQGNKELAAEAEAKVLAYEAQLDEEYHKTVPPFKPEVFAGRKEGEGDRVVLLELFTGAQCPPCVAADVAFDALGIAYKPTEVIGLQYHLHIPGPDPLTNNDTIARAEYYPDLQGTPATFFNGKSEASGGGDMGMSKGKFDDYVQVIKDVLKQKKKATIDLQVNREGEDVKIKVIAKSDVAKQEKDPDKAAYVKLRLALVEEQIRYVGRNRLRFHHRVVRAMPGGAAGKAFDGGEVKVEHTVNLASLRKSLETYLSDFAKENGSFAGPLPSLSLENLSVVAFVQDDRDKSVLHAVEVPVTAAKKSASE